MTEPRFDERLRWIGRAVAGRLFVAGWARAVALAILLGLLLAAIDAWRPMHAWLRATIAVGWILGLALALAREARRAKRSFPTPRAAARLVEQRAGIPHNRLINAFDLAHAPAHADPSPFAAALVGRAIALGARALESGEDRIVLAPERRLSRRALGALLAAGAIIALAWFAADRVLSAAFPRFAEPFADHPPYSPTEFTLLFLPHEPAVGDDIRLTIHTSGRPPDSLRLAVRDSSGGVTRLPASELTDARAEHRRAFEATLRNVRDPLRVYAEGPTGRSRGIDIVPTREPRLLDATLRITPPPYTRLAVVTRSLRAASSSDDAVRAVAGSRIEFHATATLPMRAESLTITPNEPFDRRTEGRALTAVIPFARPGEFEFNLLPTGETGVRSRDQHRFSFTIVPDEPPTLVLDQPRWSGKELLAPARATLHFKARASDDFGLHVLAFAWARLDPRGVWIDSGLIERTSLERPPIITTGNQEAEFDARLALPRLSVNPGDSLIITLLAMDTLEAPYGEPQHARLAPIIVRIAPDDPGAPTGGECDGWIEMPTDPATSEPADPSRSASERARSADGQPQTWESPSTSDASDARQAASHESRSRRWPSPSQHDADASGSSDRADVARQAERPAETPSADEPIEALTPLTESPRRADASADGTISRTPRDATEPDLESLRALPEAYRDVVSRYFRLLNAPTPAVAQPTPAKP